MLSTDPLSGFNELWSQYFKEAVVKTSVLCRICGRRLGTIRDFEGRVFTLCLWCEKALKAINV